MSLTPAWNEACGGCSLYSESLLIASYGRAVPRSSLGMDEKRCEGSSGLPRRFWRYLLWIDFWLEIMRGFMTTCTLGKFWRIVSLVLFAILLYFASSCLVEL